MAIDSNQNQEHEFAKGSFDICISGFLWPYIVDTVFQY